ncbi:MAG: hypothetical protein DRJ40_06255 [Thermoprotei archaeon]|nr:MAG: hypothetical protein DRJ40_06255 [Thermoprotei archaeon]
MSFSKQTLKATSTLFIHWVHPFWKQTLKVAHIVSVLDGRCLTAKKQTLKGTYVVIDVVLNISLKQTLKDTKPYN